MILFDNIFLKFGYLKKNLKFSPRTSIKEGIRGALSNSQEAMAHNATTLGETHQI